MDISFLRERDNPGSFSVTELNNYIKNLFDGNRTLSAVTVKGEISNFKNHSTGHLYFSLKDEEGQIRAVMFRSKAMSLKFMPESGMRVIAHGSVTIYPRDGSYQLYVNSLQPDGIGALYLAYEQLKDKLYQEGLFDESHKKPIPYAPQSVGVITSPTGAAVRDIINVISRRFPIATVYLYPALVQGEGAEESLISGLDYFEKSALADVIILGRGGGSIEDLWAFNGERLARKIFAATTPIISAVGHETDFTIADFVSDLRAPTPSAAAELAVPDSKELLMRIDGIGESGSKALERRLAHVGDGTASLGERPDLILLDGGVGQVGAVRRVMERLGVDIPLYGMVKDDYHKTRALTDGATEISIAREMGVYTFIYNLQEEAHRFAVKSSSGAKRRTMTHSVLEKIPGVGPAKARVLLAAMPLGRIKVASAEELGRVKGISEKDAENIVKYFSGGKKR